MYTILCKFRNSKESVIWSVRLDSFLIKKFQSRLVNKAKLNYHRSRRNWSLSQIFGGTFVFRVMQGGRLSWRRLFSRTYLHFFVLTLWDYFTQGASHTRTKRFTLLIVLCLVYTVSMTVSGSCKGKRVLPNPRHKRLRHMNTDLRKRRLGTIMLCKADISYDHCTKVVPQVTYKLYS